MSIIVEDTVAGGRKPREDCRALTADVNSRFAML